jgi:TonB family protein
MISCENDTTSDYVCPCIWEEEQPPFYKSCEDLFEADDQYDCMRDALVKEVYQNIEYPESAREHCIEGTVVVKLHIDIEGKVIKKETINEPLLGFGLEQAALKLISQFDDNWCPGLINCESVEMIFTMPVKYKLAK